jgi:hypothetical protein
VVRKSDQGARAITRRVSPDTPHKSRRFPDDVADARWRVSNFKRIDDARDTIRFIGPISCLLGTAMGIETYAVAIST